MTAEFSLEIESKHENSIIEELASDYSRYLDVDASKQRQSFYDSIEEMLTKLDEFGGLVDMIRSDTSLCVDKTVPDIQAKCESMQQIFERIDKLEAFVNIVKQNVNTMEECVNKAENDMGSFSGLKKMLSSFVSPKRTQDTKLSFDPPEIFVTEEYLLPPSHIQSNAGNQETLKEQDTNNTQDKKDSVAT